MDNGRSLIVFRESEFQNKLSDILCVRGFSDGGVRNQADWRTLGLAACGWVLQFGFSFDSSSKVCWTTVAYGAVLLGSSTNSFEAELAGVQGLVQSLLHCFELPGECGHAKCWIDQYGRS